MTERLLVLGGGRQALKGLEHLKAIGFELVVCDFDPEAPGFAMADHRILASVYHLEECLPAVRAFHKTTPISGVMCLACDVPHIVARIAADLNLPGIQPGVADRAVNKLLMKDKFRADGIAIPRYWTVSAASEILSLFDEFGLDEVVVKPVDSRGSKGVSRLKRAGDSSWSFAFARDNSPTQSVMVEEYLSGPQVSTESVVIEGHAITPALSDRSYEHLDAYYPFIVENGGDMPSALGDDVTEKIKSLVDAAARSLGVDNGIVKGDIVVHDGVPNLIELAARLSGGYFCTHQIPLSTGVNLVEASARIALGQELEPGDWEAKRHDHISTRWKIVGPGTVTKISDPDEIRSLPNVKAFETWVKEGDVIAEAQNAAASIAMVQAAGRTQVEAKMNAINALEQYEVLVE